MNVFKTTCYAVLSVAALASCHSTTQQQDEKKPEDNRFTKVVLAQRIEEPMQFQIMKDGRVLYAERKGKLKVYHPETGKVTVIGQFDVSTKYTSKTGEVSEGEDGLQGVILDPDYDENHWIYLYYSPAGSESKNTLVRYTWLGEGLIENSRKVLLDVPVQRLECCHVGGGMVFDKDKNLYLSTGDNTFSRASDGFSPLDERPGEFPRDAQKSSGNTNDLRGKILRIHPEADGTYTIPKGNLFPKGTEKTRPEIYTMGNRNPWRLTIDSKTGWLYWGEVGPDGGRDDLEKRGPQSYDEFNQAKKPGNYGWPYFVADNKAYRKYDFATQVSGEPFDPAHPVNHSPNNTGLNDLPPATPAFVWYPKGEIAQFPLLGSGSNSAVGGPIYHRRDFDNPKRPFPAYYEGKWFVTDWARGWINVISVDDDGNYKGMERFLPDERMRGPIDMKFGPEGDLYVLEYGNGYFKDNPEAELVRFEYNGGNRKPQVQATASKTAGALPLTVKLSSAGTQDFDEGDVLSYAWKITKNGATYKTLEEADPAFTFTDPGVYTATLTVTDAKGAQNSQSVTIQAGNEPPAVKLTITKGNTSFFFPGSTLAYNVTVDDKEDGSLENKGIMPEQVSVTADYLAEGYDQTTVAQSHINADASAQSAGAPALINNSDCKSCHAVDTKVLGPAFMEVSKKYKTDPNAADKLSQKIISGGSGVWGDAMMPAHPTMADADARTIVRYILALSNPAPKPKVLPVKGNYVTTVPTGQDTNGNFVLRAAYTDKGTTLAPAQTAESVIVLSPPVIPVSKATDAQNMRFNNDIAMTRDGGASMKLGKMDLTGVKAIEIVRAMGGRPVENPTGSIELYADAAHTQLLGKFSGAYKDRKSFQIALPANTGMTEIYAVFSGSPVRIAAFRIIKS